MSSEQGNESAPTGEASTTAAGSAFASAQFTFATPGGATGNLKFAVPPQPTSIAPAPDTSAVTSALATLTVEEGSKERQFDGPLEVRNQFDTFIFFTMCLHLFAVTIFVDDE